MIEDTLSAAIANLPNFAVALLVLRWQHTALETLLKSQEQVIEKLFQLQDKLTDKKPPDE